MARQRRKATKKSHDDGPRAGVASTVEPPPLPSGMQMSPAPSPATTPIPVDLPLPSGTGVYRRSWPSASGYFYFLFLAVVFAASLWIRSGFPVYVISGTGYDDLLFLELAISLSKGRWLGPFNQVTLAKGMFYSIFVCLSHLTAVPLKIAEQLVYLAVCVSVAELVRRRTGKQYLAALLFLLLALNPVVWNSQMARVIREGLYLSLSLAVIVLSLVVMFPVPEQGRSALVYRLGWGVGLGLVGVAYWLTREEGIWLVPSLGVVFLMGAVRVIWPGAESTRLMQAKTVALPLVLAILVFLGGDFLVAELNYRYYGIFETNEFRSKSFLAAYGAISRIKHDHWEQYIVFPRDARERAYAVSPAARELQPSFEGADADKWRGDGCAKAHFVGCAEDKAGGLMWEFRDTLSAAGHYRTGQEAMRFYDTLASQINAACDQGTIPCLPRRDSMLPPFRSQYLSQSIEAGGALAKIMFTLREGPVGTLPSEGPPSWFQLFSEWVRPVSLPKELYVEGRIGSDSGMPTLRLIAQDTERPEYHTTIGPPQDTVARYATGDVHLKTVSFQMTTNCVSLDCQLIVEVPGAMPVDANLKELFPGRFLGSPSAALMIDQIVFPAPKAPQDIRPSAQVSTASLISNAYAIGIPALTVFAAVGLILALAQKGRRHIPLEVLALVLASLTAIGTRIALLSYITATSFPAASLLYASPASSFVIIFAALGCYCGYSALRSMRRPQ